MNVDAAAAFLAKHAGRFGAFIVNQPQLEGFVCADSRQGHSLEIPRVELVGIDEARRSDVPAQRDFRSLDLSNDAAIRLALYGSIEVCRNGL